MVDYGSGLFLDDNFDLSVDATGDVAGASGPDELRKDLAFRIAAFLEDGFGVDTPESVSDGIVGGVVRNGLMADLRIGVVKAVEADSRVDAVDTVLLSRSDTDRNQLDVDVRVVAADDIVDVSVTAP